MNTVTLQFRPDDQELKEASALDLPRLDPAVVEQTLLEMPIQLSVGGTHLLAHRSAEDRWIGTTEGPVRPAGRTEWIDEWLRLPIIHVAVYGTMAVSSMRTVDRGAYEMPGGARLTFIKKDAETIRVTSSLNNVSVDTELAPLELAFVQFRRNVGDWLRVELRELTAHPRWQTWFGESEATGPKT